jgi:hypothetical protein
MSAFISDKSLMTIVEVLRDIDGMSVDEHNAFQECLCGLEGITRQDVTQSLKSAVIAENQLTERPETPDENIWQAFERVLEEHGPIEAEETPEEAAERHANQVCPEQGPEFIVWCMCHQDFLAGVRWAEERGRKG